MNEIDPSAIQNPSSSFVAKRRVETNATPPRLLLITSLVMDGCSSCRPQANPGLNTNHLAPCSRSPNFPLFEASYQSQRVEPLRHNPNAAQSQHRLLAVLQHKNRLNIFSTGVCSVHAAFRSTLINFLDDVASHFDENRQRMKAISAGFFASAGAGS